MEKIILDFRNCKNAIDIHSELKEKFVFPNYYGGNLSALWDCLDNYCNWDLCVTIYGTEKISKEWQPYMKKILKVFQDVHKKTPNVTFDVVS